jgi:hypothetical protein
MTGGFVTACTQVELQDCGISPVGVRSLAAAVEDAIAAAKAGCAGGAAVSGRSKPRLQVLHLDGNPLGFSGTSALRPLLSVLRELYLGSAGLGDEGMLFGCLLLLLQKLPFLHIGTYLFIWKGVHAHMHSPACPSAPALQSERNAMRGSSSWKGHLCAQVLQHSQHPSQPPRPWSCWM